MQLAELTQRFTQHHQLLKKVSLLSLFNDDADRAVRFCMSAAELKLDFSKHFCTTETLALFENLTRSVGLREHIQDLFKGVAVNGSEQRPALHTALRSTSADSPNREEITATLARMRSLVAALSGGRLQGFGGKPFTDIVNIGIGGSDLGPRFVTTALAAYRNTALRVHFVANVDPDELRDTLDILDPHTTLFITASKSFTTLETLSNTQAARHWLQTAAGDASVDNHFISITPSPAKALAYGIPEAQIFPLWDWGGGRYSLWSAIGLPIAIALGWDNFRALLDGAAAMDNHYREAPFTANMPALLALLEWW